MDDMMRKLIAAKQAEMSEIGKLNKRDAQAAAEDTKTYYDSFIKAGFNPSQALRLTCTILAAVVGNTK